VSDGFSARQRDEDGSVGTTQPNSSRSTENRDRDAYFVAAFDLLAEQGVDGVTIAAMCDRLGVTKGSFYHHFTGMPGFVEALAGHWQADTIRWLDGLDAISNPYRQLETLQNEVHVRIVGAEPAIRAWARSNTSIRQALEAVHERFEPQSSAGLAAIVGDPDLGHVLACTFVAMSLGVQLRMDPIGADDYRTYLAVLTRRLLDVQVELLDVDGTPRNRIDETRPAGFDMDPAWKRPPALPRATPPAADQDADEPAKYGRDAFFVAARHILVHEGGGGINMTALCKRVFVTKGSFVHHFGSMPRFVEALTREWESARTTQLAEYRLLDDPGLRMAHLLRPFIKGADTLESAWRAWGHHEPVIGQALSRADQQQQRLIARTLTELSVDAADVDVLSEMTVGLGIGLLQPRPQLSAEQSVWITLEWARRVLRLDVDLRLADGDYALHIAHTGPGVEAGSGAPDTAQP
jgi:AcrR family transcriptional regulator